MVSSSLKSNFDIPNMFRGRQLEDVSIVSFHINATKSTCFLTLLDPLFLAPLHNHQARNKSNACHWLVVYLSKTYNLSDSIPIATNQDFARDVDMVPNSPTRTVRIVGSLVAITKALLMITKQFSLAEFQSQRSTGGRTKSAGDIPNLFRWPQAGGCVGSFVPHQFNKSLMLPGFARSDEGLGPDMDSSTFWMDKIQLQISLLQESGSLPLRAESAVNAMPAQSVKASDYDLLGLDPKAVLDPSSFLKKWSQLPISISQECSISPQAFAALTTPQEFLRHMQAFSVTCKHIQSTALPQLVKLQT